MKWPKCATFYDFQPVSSAISSYKNLSWNYLNRVAMDSEQSEKHAWFCKAQGKTYGNISLGTTQVFHLGEFS